MNKKIKYLLITLVITMIFVSGCSSKDSGLYRLETGTDSIVATDSRTGGSTENDSGADNNLATDSGADKSDNGSDSTDSAGGLSANSTAGSTQAGASMTSESTSVSLDVNNSASSDISVNSLKPDIQYVHVCGAVNSPGVYELKSGDRVFTAIRKAGGFTDDADESYINLAMAVCDGMKINVPTVEETSGADAAQIQAVTFAYEGGQYLTGPQSGTSGSGSDASGNTSPGSSGTPASGASGTNTSGSSGTNANASGAVNINTADISGLTTISGIGKTRAEAIIAYREEHGAFTSVEDIKNVSGIGNATYEKLKDQITVD